MVAKKGSFVPDHDLNIGIAYQDDEEDLVEMFSKQPQKSNKQVSVPGSGVKSQTNINLKPISPIDSKTESPQHALLKRMSSVLQNSRDKRSSTQALNFKHEDFIGEETRELEDVYCLYEPPLGSGLYGSVYRAQHKVNKTLRAVKRIKRSVFEESGSSLEMLLKDFHVLKHLTHPNIIVVYEYFLGAEYVSVVTDLCEGGELFDRIIQDTRFEEAKAAYYINQVLSAIAYCHSQKLAHCDLKPENMVLQSQGSDIIKIIDFGSSAYTDNKRLTNRFGTVYYIAPEVLRGDYDERCDLWSIGVILYILLSGIPPFNGRNDQEILQKVSMGHFSFSHSHWDNISEKAKDLISQLLKFKPEDRITAQEALNHPWLKEWRNPNKLESCPIAKSSLRAMRDFRADCKLQEAILSYLMIHLISQQEQNMMLDAFMQMDMDGDGKLSLEDLLAVYVKLGKNQEDAETLANSILKNSNGRGDGYIDFSEFLKLSISQRRLLTEHKLRKAFDRFDQSGSGLITLDDLKSVLNKGVFRTLAEEQWVGLLQEATVAGHSAFGGVKGKAGVNVEKTQTAPTGLTFERFRDLMQRYAQNESITQSLTQPGRS